MKHDLFFTPDFAKELIWKGKSHLRVGSVRPHNKKQISEGLRDMSPESIRHRFLGSKRDFSEQELQYLTQLDGWNHYALGIEETQKLKRGVGLIRMVRASHSETEAEIAITIIDEYQRMGFGTFLLDMMILAGRERNIETFSFTFLSENEAIVKLINKAGAPVSRNHNRDYEQLLMDISKANVEVIKTRWEKNLPGIETFHLKT